MNYLKRGWLPVSLSIVTIYMSLIPLPFLRELKFVPSDKAMHAAAFCVLAILYRWSFEKNERLKQANLISLVITLIIGGGIELLQHYLPVNRHGDWYDFLFDLIGIIFALILYPMIRKRMPAFMFLIAIGFGTPLNGQKSLEDARLFQEELLTEYGDPETSPLKAEDLENFAGLEFFPLNETYQVLARLERVEEQPFFQMKTTTQRLPEYRLWGKVFFELHGKSLQLEIYQNKNLMDDPEYFDYLFLPFTDLTNGDETYAGGRYIDIRMTEGDSIFIDFNKAYNPYCAYNKKYSCPIVPAVNHLAVRIEAGVKDF